MVEPVEPGVLWGVDVVVVVVVDGGLEVVVEPPVEAPLPEVVVTGADGITTCTTVCCCVDESLPEPGGGAGFTGATGGACCVPDPELVLLPELVLPVLVPLVLVEPDEPEVWSPEPDDVVPPPLVVLVGLEGGTTGPPESVVPVVP